MFTFKKYFKSSPILSIIYIVVFFTSSYMIRFYTFTFIRERGGVEDDSW